MAFPSNNAEIAGRLFGNVANNAVTTHAFLLTGQHNWFSTPAVIDVSGMEIDVYRAGSSYDSYENDSFCCFDSGVYAQ